MRIMKVRITAVSLTLAVLSFCLLVALHIDSVISNFEVANEPPLWLTRVEWFLKPAVIATVYIAVMALVLHCFNLYRLPRVSVIDLCTSLILAVFAVASSVWIMEPQDVIHTPTPAECAQMRLLIPIDAGLLIAYVLLRLMAADTKQPPTGGQTEQTKAVRPPAHGMASWYARFTWAWLFLAQGAGILWLWATVTNRPALFGSESLPDVYFRLWFVCGIGILVILTWGILLLLRLGIVQLPRRGTYPHLRPDAVNVVGGLFVTAVIVATLAILAPLPYPDYYPPVAWQFTQIATVIVLDIMVATAFLWAKRKYA